MFVDVMVEIQFAERMEQGDPSMNSVGISWNYCHYSMRCSHA